MLIEEQLNMEPEIDYKQPENFCNAAVHVCMMMNNNCMAEAGLCFI
jgi:hypothetical protein